MQLVIDIPEETYNLVKDCPCNPHSMMYELVKCIENGTPLPKGHGRLVDADMLKDDAQTMTEWNGDVFRCVTERIIDLAPTIIEADKEDNDADND